MKSYRPSRWQRSSACGPLIAHCRKGLGALYGRTGREEKGREELTAAMDMYRDMEMTFWLEKAEGAMAEVG